MTKRDKFAIFVMVLLIFSLTFFSNVDFNQIYNLPEGFMANFSDVDKVNENGTFGGFIRTSLEKDQTNVSSEKDKSGTIVFKLFGLIPIRKVKVTMLPEEEVYIGGVPIGINVQSQGAIVISETSYEGSQGEIEVVKNQYFKAGDILKTINGNEIHDVDEVERLLQNNTDGIVKIEYLRNNKLKSAEVKLLKNSDGEYKLGLWARDDMSGIGTLTFVHKDNNHYCALGHAITDGHSDNIIPVSGGKVYDCSLIGINKGKKNDPGELKGLFMQSDAKGTIEKNCNFGISGVLDELDSLVDGNLTAKIGGRLSVRPGKAKIVSSVSGIREEYEIEIIKASYQAKQADKSMVFRVKDKRLIDLTGGIVQGMSGSPIIQDGKIIGAVTHVFLSDATKGYGVYSDWMLEEGI